MSKKNNKLKLTPKAEPKREYPRYYNYAALFSLFIIFVLSLYIRAVMPFKNTWGDGLPGYALDDAVMQIRLVENTIANFPTRIDYDIFTQYPFGNPLHWGPLFTQSIALIAIIFGYIFDGGYPSENTINIVGMIYPAVLGALVVFPAYFITKHLIGIRAALISALLVAIIPGQWLSRSMLGFVDSHVAEVLFLTLTICMFIISMRKSSHLTYPQIQKMPLLYAILSGVALGGYLLNWTAGILFIAVLIIFVFIQAILDKWKGRDSYYLMVTGAVTFLTALLMILPAVKLSNGFDSAYYSLAHVTILLLGIVTSVVLVILSRKSDNLKLYLTYLVLASLASIIAIRLIIPQFFEFILNSIAFAFNARVGGQLTVAEATPTCGGTDIGSILTCPRAIYEFGYNYYIAMIGLAMLTYYTLKTKKPVYTIVLVWSLFVLTITIFQNRFTYYYAINIAILSAFVFGSILNLVHTNRIVNIAETKPYHVIVLAILLIVSIYPIYNTTLGYAQGGKGAGFYEWREALTWMRNNTPDPGIDYYGTYERPPKNVPYPYPSSAYGVMSWWDEGHMISYWAHRIPVANPFQAGIGGGPNHAPGASTFLTAQTEAESLRILDAFGKDLNVTGVKYVISDAYMAYSIQDIFAIWNQDPNIQCADPRICYDTAIRTNKGVQPIPGLRQFNSIEGRLHILDGNGLQHYRLIHESSPNPGLLRGRSRYDDSELAYKQIATQFYNIPVKQEVSGYVKIFEVVKGARIMGKTSPNTTVDLMTSLTTNINRTFVYTQSVTSSPSGSYEFTVPHAVTYALTSGNISKQLDVSENAVTSGQSISIDL